MRYIKGSPLATAQLVIANTAFVCVGLFTVAVRTLTFAFTESCYMNEANVKRFKGEGQEDRELANK